MKNTINIANLVFEKYRNDKAITYIKLKIINHVRFEITINSLSYINILSYKFTILVVFRLFYTKKLSH